VQRLVHDSRVAAVHMTGSTATYNAIVWGQSQPGSGRQLVTKPFEAELG
jgi:acyl-CoA reductase-like NAD-dependent aldehyde dehydrogenase